MCARRHVDVALPHLKYVQLPYLNGSCRLKRFCCTALGQSNLPVFQTPAPVCGMGGDTALAKKTRILINKKVI